MPPSVTGTECCPSRARPNEAKTELTRAHLSHSHATKKIQKKLLSDPAGSEEAVANYTRWPSPLLILEQRQLERTLRKHREQRNKLLTFSFQTRHASREALPTYTTSFGRTGIL